MSDNGFAGAKFNIVTHRGDPTSATLTSGHRVSKQNYIFYVDSDSIWQKIKCSDYHGSHFLYLDPIYQIDGQEGKGHWAFMCTCGSPAVIVGPEEASFEDSGAVERLLVCYAYHLTLREYGHGWHQGSDGATWT